MKIECPKCHVEIPTEDIRPQDGIAYCRECNEGWSIREMLGGGGDAGAPTPAEKPEDTKVQFVSQRGEHLALVLPAGGFRGLGCFMTLFTVFWNAITWTFVLGGVFAGEADPFLFLFMIPFVLVGLVTLAIALYAVFGRFSLAMNREQVLFRREIFGRRFEKKYDIADVTGVSLAEAYQQNNRPIMGVGIRLSSKSSPATFGSGLKDGEKDWLLWEVYDFWQSVKSLQAST